MELAGRGRRSYNEERALDECFKEEEKEPTRELEHGLFMYHRAQKLT